MNILVPATDLLATITPTLAQVQGQQNTTSLIEAMGDNFVILIIFGVGGFVAFFAILLGTLSNVACTREAEQTKREVAAYVAEGSMTPADAERILRSSGKNKG